MSREHWKRPFENLQQQLTPLVESNQGLFHGILMTPLHGRDEATQFANYLEPAQMADDLVGVVETPTRGCGFHAHYFYGDKKALILLQDLLSQLHTWVGAIPSGLLPEFTLPAIRNQKSKNLVLWSNLVYALAWRFDRWYFRACGEYQQRLDRIDFRPWEDLIQPPGVDLRAVLTHQKPGANEFQTWVPRFDAAARKIPEYVGAYLQDTGSHLCGEFLRASHAAIDLLGTLGSGSNRGVLTPPAYKMALPTRKRRRTTRSNLKKGESLTEDGDVLLSFLIHHHGCHSGKPNYQPIGQKQIAKELSERIDGWNQSRVSRSLDKLMSGIKRFGEVSGSQRYRKLCEAQLIDRELIRLELTKVEKGIRRYVGVENMDLFAAPKSREPDLDE